MIHQVGVLRDRPVHAFPVQILTATSMLLQLRVSMRYLRDVLQMRFPQLRARSAAAEAEARAREVIAMTAQLVVKDSVFWHC